MCVHSVVKVTFGLVICVCIYMSVCVYVHVCVVCLYVRVCVRVWNHSAPTGWIFMEFCVSTEICQENSSLVKI